MPDQAPDPLERALRSLASSAAQSAHGPDPAEIRTRGARRHRRRVSAVAALSTVAVVTTGTVAFGVSRDLGSDPVPPAASSPTSSVPSTLTPNPMPEGGWLQEIPANFVLDADMPLDDGGPLTRDPEEGLGIPDVEICGTPAFDGTPPAVDDLGLDTPLQYRGVVLYADDLDARTALHSVTDRAAACPQETSADSLGDGGWTVESLDEGPATAAVLAHTLVDEATVYYHLVQRGNAVAVVSGSLENARADMLLAVERARLQGEEAAAGLSSQMCVFTVEGCAETDPPPVTATPVDAPLSGDNLSTAAELPGYNDITGWKTTSTAPGDGQAAVSICQQSSLAGLGAVDVWKRDYTSTIDYPPNTTPDPKAVPGYTGISIAQFADDGSAQDAYDEMRSWMDECSGDGRSVSRLGSVTVAGGSGKTFLVTFPAGAGNRDESVIDGEAVGLFGSRVVLIAQTSRGKDYNYPAGQTPIDGALQAALTRLADGVSE